jgi:DNA-binding response OmpR family regulator
MTTKKPLILYVDDDPEALNILKVGLEDRSFTVMTALSAKDAYDILKQYTPDAIIADLRMQPVNGFDLYQELKKSPAYSRVPFLFLTAIDDQIARNYGSRLGVDAYITKPIDIDVLETELKHQLSKK